MEVTGSSPVEPTKNHVDILYIIIYIHFMTKLTLESLEETVEVISILGVKASIKEGLKQAKKGLGIKL